MTDIANASKHMVLDRRARTGLWGSANVENQSTGGAIGGGPIGGAPIGGTSDRLVVKIDNTFHDVLDCVTAVHTVWIKLMRENTW